MRRLGVLALTMIVALTAAGVASAGSADEAAAAPPEDGVVVYYFHGDVRCATCRKLEAYSEEAVRTGFAADLESGAMSYRAVNIDQEPNKHFLTDFQLTNKAVVVVEYAGGEPVRYENLSKVWQLVRSKEKFVGYVQEETRAFVGGA
jgi:hypothetical protein